MTPISKNRTSTDYVSDLGFSLIEVLVALLVLSVGLLGLAALQTMGLKLNHQSYERTQAVLQAYDIIDRMRANRTSANAGINANYNSIAHGYIPSSFTNCMTTACSSDQAVVYDTLNWNAANASVLAEGKGAVCKGTFTNDANNNPTGCNVTGSIFRVAITWKEQDLFKRLDVEVQP